jgi:lactoylglutathione lyase
MIKQVGQIMLYVNNQDEAVNFWTERAGFHVLAEEDNGQGMRWIEVWSSHSLHRTGSLADCQLKA